MACILGLACFVVLTAVISVPTLGQAGEYCLTKISLVIILKIRGLVHHIPLLENPPKVSIGVAMTRLPKKPVLQCPLFIKSPCVVLVAAQTV